MLVLERLVLAVARGCMGSEQVVCRFLHVWVSSWAGPVHYGGEGAEHIDDWDIQLEFALEQVPGASCGVESERWTEPTSLPQHPYNSQHPLPLTASCRRRAKLRDPVPPSVISRARRVLIKRFKESLLLVIGALVS